MEITSFEDAMELAHNIMGHNCPTDEKAERWCGERKSCVDCRTDALNLLQQAHDRELAEARKLPETGYTRVTEGLRLELAAAQMDEDARKALLDHCDAVDALHASLEDENAALKGSAARLRDGGHEVGTDYMTVRPRIDWSDMVQELDEFAALVQSLAGDAE